MSGETIDQTGELPRARGEAPSPGVVVVFTAGAPATIALPLADGVIEIGRDHPAFAAQPDARMSRRHAVIRFDGRRFLVTDAGSRNGTSADGALVAGGAPREATRVIRVGNALLVPVRDVAPFQRLGVRVAGGRVEGPALQEALLAAARAARLGGTLHITGESGAGKEGLARTFHAMGPAASGPFQAVNCATIAEGVAERLLFGAKRGAFSGADADADGYVQAAHGGTLFLDEVAELSPAVQAKLLRVLETGEVLQLGAARARRVDLRFCSATHRDLRAQVAAGKLREDLYFRIATPRVAAPPLRDRLEEIPFLLHAAATAIAPGLGVHPSLVEACMLRPWPGNVRELLAEGRAAAQVAHGAGAARVELGHLDPNAGLAFSTPEVTEPEAAPAAPPPTRARIVTALKRAGGNVSAAARALGAHRTQLYRWMERHAIEPAEYASGAPDPDEP